MLPGSTVQRFGMVIVIVVLAAAIAEVGDKALLAGVLSAGMACVLLGGTYDRARYQVERVMGLPDDKSTERAP